jgi:hypothetical protein
MTNPKRLPVVGEVYRDMAADGKTLASKYERVSERRP